jgi:hypothetical protein
MSSFNIQSAEVFAMFIIQAQEEKFLRKYTNVSLQQHKQQQLDVSHKLLSMWQYKSK